MASHLLAKLLPSWELRAALLLAPAVLSGCAEPVAAEPPPPDGWHVRDGFIREADGRAVILRGVNLANAHKQAPYLGFHEPADYERLTADWSFNAVRFLLTWAAVEPEQGHYDEAYLDEVAERLDWAAEAGLHVVLDMHQDIYGEGFGGDGAPRWTCDEEHYEAYEPVSPWFLNYLNEHVIACFDQLWHSAELQQHYAAAWQQVASRLGDHEAVIGFDIMNEPHWGSAAMGSFESELLQPFYEQVIAAVRQIAPGWLAFVEPAASRNLGLPTRLVPFPFANVVYAPHSYDTEAEQGNGFDPAARAALLTDLALLREEATALGAALWIGEYGGQASLPGIVEYMDAQYDGQAAVAAGSMYWSYDRDSGYGLLNPDGSEKTELLDVLVRPYPERVAGQPLSFALADDSTGDFTFSWRSSGAGVTEIAVPERAYPQGYEVSCEGCEWQQQPGRLVIASVPADVETELTVAPAP